MNDNSVDFKAFCRVMENLRKKVGELESLPNIKLREINSLEEISQDERGTIEEQLWDIFVYGEYFIAFCVKKIRPILLKGNAPKEVGQHLRFHRTKYESFINHAKKLIDVSKAPSRHGVESIIVHLNKDGMPKFHSDINQKMGEYEFRAERGWLNEYVKSQCDSDSCRLIDTWDNNNVTGDFVELITEATILHDYATNPGSRLADSVRKIASDSDDDDEVEAWGDQILEALPERLSNCQEVISKSYFKPDDWIANEEKLPCFSMSETLEPRIFKRICEIHNSFIFGNWMSVVALSRCLLEYMLTEKESDPDSNININHKSNEHPSLKTLCSAAGKGFPKLKKNMKYIREEGNKMMHYPKENNENFPPNRKIAEDCIKHIAKIINTLYSPK